MVSHVPGNSFAYIVGTFDTKRAEFHFIRDTLRAAGVAAKTVDLSTSGQASAADITAAEVASHHPKGAKAVFNDDRGRSVAAMAIAFANWVGRQADIGGMIAAGGSGNTSLATAGMRQLPVGIPKIMVSTVASGDVGRYVGSADIMMVHSVADIQGINRITERVLANAAHALAGMMAHPPRSTGRQVKPAIGITMFGVTTPCVQAVQKRLEDRHDCLIFHATGTGGRAMEKLADSGLLAAMLDLTTTEVADMIVGGVLAADEDRFGAAIRAKLPYVGSVGAMDMVNFGPRDTVPERFAGRNFVIHNPHVTLMRTTPEENRAIGKWIGARLNAMEGPVRFLLPEGGVSTLDAPSKPFHDLEADEALFRALETTVRRTSQRRIERVAAHINDAVFVDRVIAAFEEIV